MSSTDPQSAASTSASEPQIPPRRRRWKSALCVAIGLLIVAAVVLGGWAVHAAGEAIPAPTGSQKVGRTTFRWFDKSRAETQSPAVDDFRFLRVDLWYPATPASDSAAAPYSADYDKIKGHLGLERWVLGLLRTHAYVDPPMDTAGAPYPVILLSPGNGNNGADYTAFAEELVSYGFVVVTIDHPFQSRAIACPDGSVVTTSDPFSSAKITADAFEKHYRDRVDERITDSQFVLDQLLNLNSQHGGNFSGRLDLDRIGVMGHSIGGVAAAQACLVDERFKAAVNLDGRVRSLPFFPVESEHLKRPLLDLSKGQPPITEKLLAQQERTREELERTRGEDAHRYEDLMRMAEADCYLVTIRGASHDSFGDSWLWYPGPLDERHEKTQTIRDYLRQFFQKYLQGKESPKLDTPEATDPAAEVRRFTKP